MKSVRYSRYTGEDLGIGAEELLKALADFLLESGFNTQYMPFSEWNQHTLEDLKKAIQQALEQGKLFDDEALQEMMERLQSLTPEQMDKLLENLVQKMVDEGQITIEEPGERRSPAPAVGHGRDSKVRFEVTDKSLDFLGFKTLKDLLGSLGKSSFGRHDTRDLATGIEACGSSRQYEFGDTLNLDVSETLFSAIRREGAKVPLDMNYSDLHVHQCEYQSSCATVLMLDCSHSMILYGEDRFTPAKKVALALAHLIRTQYPGDSLRCVLFHDTAEELALSQLARVQVGPYYTNTRDGLILARKLLNQERKGRLQRTAARRLRLPGWAAAGAGHHVPVGRLPAFARGLLPAGQDLPGPDSQSVRCRWRYRPGPGHDLLDPDVPHPSRGVLLFGSDMQ